MTPRERQLLVLRYAEIDAELLELAEGRVVDGIPATVEQSLLGEQDEIEHKLGEDHFEQREAE